MISRYCPFCGAKNLFDEDWDSYICASCGAENNVHDSNSTASSNDNSQKVVTYNAPQYNQNNTSNNINPSGNKKKSGCGTAILIVVITGIVLFFVRSCLNTITKPSQSTSSNTTISTTTTSETTGSVTTVESTVDLESFIESCSELDYKALARNPDDYVGQNFYFVCYVSSVRTGGLFTGYQRYFITYAFDLDKAQERVDEGKSDSISDAKTYCIDSDCCVWMLDNRDESDSDYIKVLDKDVIIVYGTFNGLTTSENSLTGETSEEVALDVKYVVLVSD